MLYLGIDQHRKQLTVNVRDEAGCQTNIADEIIADGGEGHGHETVEKRYYISSLPRDKRRMAGWNVKFFMQVLTGNIS
jgi:hypothetical protein